MSKYFPFSAIVGQEQMKLALILTAIDPKIGGVLVFGDRGTGKSTIVRALAGLLPRKKFVQGCPYNCEDLANPCFYCKTANLAIIEERDTPVIDLPLGSTEDRVVGALNLEIALSEGRKVFEPGLLAKANSGYLYVDEVNLLEDHIVDLLLDVAASGENLVERDGMSIRHNSKFVLIGSGNPEEGELRPQLLDRFGLSVKVGSPTKIPERVEVVKRRDEFEQDPDGFLKKWRGKDLAIRKKIITAITIKDESGKIEKIPSDCVLGFFGLIMQLGPIANWGLNIDKKTIEVDTEKFETNQKGIYAVGDICNYPGKLKLILSGFHEATLMCQSAFQRIYPDKRNILKYTTVTGINGFDGSKKQALKSTIKSIL